MGQKSNRSDKKCVVRVAGDNPQQSGPFIGKFQSAEQHLRDNSAITHGYRINFNTPGRIIKSMFMIHNETGNIWSHFLPGCIVILAILYFIVFVTHYSFIDELKTHRSNLHTNMELFVKSLKDVTGSKQFYHSNSITEDPFRTFKNNTVFTLSQLEQQIRQSGEDLITSIKEKISDIEPQNLLVLQQRTLKFQEVKLQIHSKINDDTIPINKKLQILVQVGGKAHSLKSQIVEQTDRLIGELALRQDIHFVSKWPIVVFLACGAICLFCSAVFHLFHPMSSKWYMLFLRLDYAGISIIMAGSSFPYIYYTFYCQASIGLAYLSVTSVLGVTLFFLALTDWLHKQQNRVLKTVIYAIYAAHYVIPLIHMLTNQFLFNNFGDPYKFSLTVPCIMAIFASDGFGAMIYASRCPERKNPGQYNICGHSHQLWHLGVVSGILFTYIGAMQSFELRKSSVCPI